jgi:methyl-accepting chemotaxis protein
VSDRNRALVAVGVLFAVLALAIAAAVLAIVSLGRERTVVHQENVPYAVAIATAALNAKGLANDERGYLVSGKPEFLTLLEQHVHNVRTAFAAAASAADRVRQHGAVERAHVRFEQWVSVVRGQLEAHRAGNREAATRAALGRGRVQRERYEASLADAEAAGLTPIQLPTGAFASSGWVAVFLLSLILAVLVCVALTVWLVRPPRLVVESPGQLPALRGSR